MQVGGLDAIVIRVRDWKQSQQWYTSVLGLAVASVDAETHSVLFDTGGPTHLRIWQLREGESLTATSRASSFPAFVVDDAEAMRRELAAHDVQVAPIEIAHDGSRHFAIFDPDGNRIELVQR